MNILLASNDSVFSGRPIGGAETSMAVIADELVGKGHKVIYVTLGRSGWPGRKSIILYSRLIVVMIIRPALSRFFPRQRAVKKWYTQKVIAAIIREHQIELVYAFGKIVRDLVDIKLKYGLNFPLVLRIAGINPGGKRANGKDATTSEHYLRNVNAYNFQSELHRKSYLQIREENGFETPENKELIADIGIHPDFFRVQRNGFNTDTLRILCIMRFSARKRQDLLVEAINAMQLSCLQLSFVGEGPNRSRLERKVQDYKLSEKIQFLGHLNRKELISQIEKHDVLVHPVDYEPQSKGVWEAMACGLPVICSRVPSLDNMIVHEKNGILVENTVEAWARVLQKIVAKEYTLKDIAEEGRALVQNIADPSRNIQRYIEFFHEILRQSTL